MTFDLEKARDVCAGMERFRGQTIQCTHIEAHLAAAMLPEALAEIERLRADNAGPSKAVIDIQEERDLAQAEFRAYYKAWEEQAAHVQELEDALVEERARGNHYGMSYEDATDGNFERWIIDGEKDLPKFYLDRVRTEARRQLQAEGKIGPDAKPRSWQITDERVEALKVATGEMDLSENIFYLNSLKTMLEEAGQE